MLKTLQEHWKCLICGLWAGFCFYILDVWLEYYTCREPGKALYYFVFSCTPHESWLRLFGMTAFTVAGAFVYVSGKEIQKHRELSEELSSQLDRQRQSDLKLLQSAKRIRQAYNIAGLGFWEWDIVTGDLFWSDEVFVMYGFKPREFTPTYEIFKHIVHPDDMERVQKNVDAALKDDIPYRIDFRYILPSGEIRHLHTHGEVLRDSGGQAVRFMGTQVDITERKKSESALLESEKRYRTLVETSPIPILVHSNGRVVYANSAAVSALGGKSAGDILGKSPMDFSSPEMPETFSGNAAEFNGKRDNALLMGVRMLRLDRSEFFAEACGTAIRYEGEPASQVMFMDVTERKQAEESLRELKSRLDLAKSSARLGVWDWNIKDNIMVWDDRMLELYGIPKGAFIDTIEVWEKGLHPEDREFAKDECEAAIRGGKDFDTMFRVLHPDGTVLWIKANAIIIRDDSGTAIRMTGINQDITQRKQAEEALMALSSRQAALLDSVPDIIMEVNADKVYTWANPAGYDFFGPDVTGREAGYYFEGEQDTYDAVQPLFKGCEDVFYLESWQRRKDGKKRLLAWWCRVLKDSNGSVTGALSSAQDITERKLSERELKNAEFQFRTLYELSQMRHSVKDESGKDDLVNFVLDRIIAITDSEIGFLGFMSDDEAVFTIHAWSKHALDKCNMIDKPIRYPIDKTGLWGEAVRQRRDIVVNDYEASGEPKLGLPEGHVKVKRFISIPVFDGDRIVAVAAVGNKADEYDNGDVRQIQLLSHGLWNIFKSQWSETALRESEETFRKSFENNLLLMTVSEIETGRYIRVNDRFLEVSGFGRDEVIGRTSAEIGWVKPADREKLERELRTLGNVRGMDLALTAKNGAAVHCLYSGEIIQIQGKPCLLSIAEDITYRVNAAEKIQTSLREKEVLLKEIHHRVKNNMAVISSLLAIQAGYVDDGDSKYRDMFNESQSRIRAMALVHEKLYQSENFAHINIRDYIGTLTENINMSFALDRKVAIRLDIDDMYLDIDMLIPCGLIINEILTNAYKHAFDRLDAPEIVVSLKKTDNYNTAMKISDNGHGFPEGFDISRARGLGFKLIKILAKQIDATLDVRSSQGVTFAITFPSKIERAGHFIGHG